MRFDPEYAQVLNENFEDAKTLFLGPLMAIHRAHLVMLTDRRILGADAAHALYGAFNGIPRWYRPERPRSPRELADDVLAVFLGGLGA